MERLNALNGQVCELAKQAGEKIMSFYERGTAVTWKKDRSPLTKADSASHDFLVEGLHALTPETPIISEESDEALNGLISACASFWLVDPMDGTKEFVKRTNEFTVNVALMQNGSPLLGVVRAPALNLTYYGGRNFGAWRQAGDEPPRPISTRRPSSYQLIVVASKDHAGPLVSAMLARLRNPELQSNG